MYIQSIQCIFDVGLHQVEEIKKPDSELQVNLSPSLCNKSNNGVMVW